MLAKIWSRISQPAYLVAFVGFAGFVADYLWRPISNSGLILLGFVITPFVIKLVKKISVSGLDLELLQQATEPEQQEKLEQEAKESIEIAQPAEELSTNDHNLKSDHFIKDRYIADEGLIIRELSSRSDGLLRREVKLGNRIVDLVIMSRYYTEVVEIKLFYKKFLTIQNLDIAARQISEARDYLQKMSPEKPVKPRLIVAVEALDPDLLTKARQRVAAVSNSRPEVSIDLMVLPELRKKWGVLEG